MSVPTTSKSLDDHDKPSNLRFAEPQAVSVKSVSKTDQDSNVNFSGSIRAPSPDPSLISLDDSNNVRLGRDPDRIALPGVRRQHSRSPGPVPRTWRGKTQQFWTTNKGLILVMVSQLFGTFMNVTTRLLEIEGNGGKGYHPFQVKHLPQIYNVQ